MNSTQRDTQAEMLGSEFSAVYALNTFGGIVGSLLAGFLLIPCVGSQYTLVIAASADPGQFNPATSTQSSLCMRICRT